MSSPRAALSVTIFFCVVLAVALPAPRALAQSSPPTVTTNEAEPSMLSVIEDNVDVALILVSLTALITFFGARKHLIDKALESAREEVNRRITEHLALVDPRGIPVFVPDRIFGDAGVKQRRALQKMLQSMAFVVQTYSSYDELGELEGCVICDFRPNEQKGNTESPDEKELRAYLDTLGDAIADRVGFVIYAPHGVHVTAAVTERFPTVTYANTVVTLSTNVLTIARSLAPHFASGKST